MAVRRLTVTAVVLALALSGAACGGDGDRGAQSGAASAVTSSENRTIDTWTVGDDAARTVTQVSGVLRTGEPDPCTVIEVDGTRHAVTWPPGSVRSEAGVTVGSRLYRFDANSSFAVIEDYRGPSRPVTCVTTTAWMVVK